ncbi:MAG: MMPL family transporter [Chitinophagaceae bacterium]|nr:MMPL family transporter [Chitinophagaceae bacterium]
MKQALVHIYLFFAQRKALLFVVFFGLISGFGFLASRLQFDSDLNSMMPSDQTRRDISSVLTKSKALDRILFSVSLKDTTSSDPDLLTAYTEEFATVLSRLDSGKLIRQLDIRQNEESFFEMIQAVQQNLPFLLNEQDYQQIEQLIQPEQVIATLETNYRTLASPGGLALKQMIFKDPLGLSYIGLKKLKNNQQDDQIEFYDGYLMSTDQKFLSFFAYPQYPASDTKHNEGLEKLFESTIHQLSQDSNYTSIQCDYFGGQLVAAGNAVQMRADTRLTLSITIALLLLLFVVFFRNKLAPLLVMIPVIFGGLFSMAMLYLLRGTVSVIALGASSVILGIAVNYSLHFLSHYRHSRSKEETISELTLPMTIGSFTTIAAFLSLLFVHTPVLQELGLFTAFNLIGSSLCTLIFLPHFIPAYKVDQAPLRVNWLDKLSKFQPNKNKWMVISIVIITFSLSFFIDRVKFNEDMMTMNFMTKNLQKSQAIINTRNSESLNTLFCVSEGKDLDEALRHHQFASIKLDSLKKAGLIARYSSPSDFFLSEKLQAEKVDQWNQFWSAEKKIKLLETLLQEGRNIGYNTEAFNGIRNILESNYSKPDSLFTNSFQTLFKDLMVRQKDKVILLSLVKVRQQDRESIYQSFASDADNYLTDRQRVTSEFVGFIREDFYRILFYTSFIVFFTILISYGRIEIALISFIPMVITWICILGLMGLFGIEFNIINIIISTLIFGLGDDYSIFITDGLIEKYKYGKTKIDSIKTSIYLSAITTMIGLGILIFAKHPALRSIAAVSVIGILSILFVSQTLQPLLFNFLIQNRANKKFHPFTLWSFSKSIFAFTYYALGCLMVTIVGFILTKCIPFSRVKMKYVYHVIISKMMWSLLYLMANVTKKIEGKEHKDFSKPSVIIANHASFLDLLRIISLHPKILLMTNRWVWRSPVFGALVRMADYYPVEEGAEFSVDRMKYWVDRGYSIAVFPEGTRSIDGQMKRFHKGAFYIAEKLGLDIQPVLFHGIHYTMSKGDFLLKDGTISIRFLPKIPLSDIRYGVGYAERSKLIGRYFRQSLKLMTSEKETTHYFREQLIKNYTYKGPVLEWYCRIKTRLEKNYEPIEKLVPRRGNILDIGCGYGFLSYILSWTSEERQVTGIDYDEEKIEVANHNFSKSDKLQFIAGDAMNFPIHEPYDCILIMDVLHYMTPEKQANLMDHCLQHLKPEGKLIIRDGIADYKNKHKGTVLSEFFSTRMFKFNKTENELHFLTLANLNLFAEKHNLVQTRIDETRFTSNLVTVFTKNPKSE